MNEAQQFELTVAGGLIGGAAAYLLRPSAPMVGQLPWNTIISRGEHLHGIDTVLKPVAETSFNYMIAGVIIGAILFWIISRQSRD